MAALLLVGLLLSGCGAQITPLPKDLLQELGRDMARIETLNATTVEQRITELEAELEKLEAREKNQKRESERGRINFLLGYAAEYQKTLARQGDELIVYRDARTYYTAATEINSPYGTQARYRLGILGAEGLLGDPQESSKLGISNLKMLATGFNAQVIVRNPEIAGQRGAATFVPGDAAETDLPVLSIEGAADASVGRLDELYQKSGGLNATYYRGVDTIVNAATAVAAGSRAWGIALALLFLALIVKLITMPLTTVSFRGMRDMQRVQPMIKELQEKYKDDKQKLAEEQMRLMKEHKVSPLSGCLPMLIQIPIFIVVYQAVVVYAAGFNVPFLWVPSLARPDWPLLLLYAGSLFLTQKLTATPSTDPQQQMMQKQMTLFMPVFLVLMLKDFASAFVLYWLFLNIFSSAHQYYLMRKFKLEDDAKAAAAAAVEPAPRAIEAPTTPRRKKGKRS